MKHEYIRTYFEDGRKFLEYTDVIYEQKSSNEGMSTWLEIYREKE